MAIRPFRPYVTLDHIHAFRPGQPDTRTPSPLVDAVLECFEVKKLRTAWEIGHYLQLDPRALSGALQIATGLGITELRRHWTLSYARRYAAAHPRSNADEIAAALGFKDRSSLWQTENQARLNRKQQQRRREIDERVRQRELDRERQLRQEMEARMMEGKPLIDTN